MARPYTNLDLDVLRTFVCGIDFGSYGKAAEHLCRSPSAVSSQLRKLEGQVGSTLFRKSGRGLLLTDAGERLLGYARRLLELNDEAVTAVRGSQLGGEVRFGLQEDFAEGVLTQVLGRFARAHSNVRVDVQVARNADLLRSLATGTLDLALVWGEAPGVNFGTHLADLPMCWVGAVGTARAVQAMPELPLAVFEAPCHFRGAGTEALAAQGMAWRLAFTSPSLSGLWAAARAGLCVTVRTPVGLPADLEVWGVEQGLPALPSLPLWLYQAREEVSPAVARLKTIVLYTIERELSGHHRPMTALLP